MPTYIRTLLQLLQLLNARLSQSISFCKHPLRDTRGEGVVCFCMNKYVWNYLLHPRCLFLLPASRSHSKTSRLAFITFMALLSLFQNTQPTRHSSSRARYSLSSTRHPPLHSTRLSGASAAAGLACRPKNGRDAVLCSHPHSLLATTRPLSTARLAPVARARLPHMVSEVVPWPTHTTHV